MRARLFHFLLIGAVLFGLSRAADRSLPEAAADPRVVTVPASRLRSLDRHWRLETGRSPTARERAALLHSVVDEELLVAEALRLRLDRTDGVVWRRLVDDMRFASGDESTEERKLQRQALALGLERSDPVVRRRLIHRMEGLLRAAGRGEEPSEQELAAALARNAERFARPARIRLSHVFLSRERRGASLEADARRLLADLSLEGAPAETTEAGDSFVGGNHLPALTNDELAQVFGGAFASAVAKAKLGRWSGPFASTFGLHLVWVHERRRGELPPLDRVRGRVRQAIFEDRERAALARGLERLRDLYSVRLPAEETTALP